MCVLYIIYSYAITCVLYIIYSYANNAIMCVYYTYMYSYAIMCVYYTCTFSYNLYYYYNNENLTKEYYIVCTCVFMHIQNVHTLLSHNEIND